MITNHAQQILERQHPGLVDSHLTLKRKPVGGGCHGDADRLRAQRGDAKRFSSRPVKTRDAVERGQALDRLQGLFGIGQQPARIGGIVVGKKGERLDYPLQMRALGLKVAAGGEFQALVYGEGPFAAAPRRESRTKSAKWLGDQAQLHRIAPRRKLCAQSAVALHRVAGFGIALQLEVAGQGAQRGVEFAARIHRDPPAPGNQLGHLTVRRRNTQQSRMTLQPLQNPHAVAPRDLGFRIGSGPAVTEKRQIRFTDRIEQMKFEGIRPIVSAHATDLQLGQCLAQFDRLIRGFGEHHCRMADQRDRCSRHIDTVAAAAPAHVLDASGNRGIARIEIRGTRNPGERDFAQS